MMPSFYWTDIMLWALFGLLLVAIKQILADKQKRQQWRQVFSSKTAMAAAIVLVVYFMVALADSIHFNVETQSSAQNAAQTTIQMTPLDMVFSHLIVKTERTYSAPFASHEYSRSIVYDEQGQVSQQFLPLQHVADYFSNDDKSASWYLVKQASWAFMAAVLLLFVFASIHAYGKFVAFAQLHAGEHPIKLPWQTAYVTVFILVFTAVFLYLLSFDYHVLGTSKVGDDVFYQSLKSVRTGILIGALTTVVMLPLALVLGISAGYFKGWIDDIIQYLYTTLNSIPGVLLIAAAVLVMQSIMANNADWFGSSEERADLRLLFLILILGITSWTGLCRLLRAETLKISQIEYVTAAKAFGMGPFTIIRRHIMPNLMHLVLIALVLDFSGLVLAEAVLSYVGVGVDPTTPSWGNMINQARLEMAREPMVWWSLLSAFCFMFALVLAANLFADRVQWVLNPRNNTEK
ncbi:ABC transporter permease [Thiomicrorhabdus sediminis]|nr:ABC transporter permease [Thiomicrorhabdus sediminis]